MILVVNTKEEIIGRIEVAKPHPGQSSVSIRVVSSKSFDFQISDPSESDFWAEGEIIDARIFNLDRSVIVSELDLQSTLNSSDAGIKNAVVNVACRDRAFREILSYPDSKTACIRSVESMSYRATARLRVIKADDDLAMKLFDLDEFTPI